jgi:hypothetical protein
VLRLAIWNGARHRQPLLQAAIFEVPPQLFDVLELNGFQTDLGRAGNGRRGTEPVAARP